MAALTVFTGLVNSMSTYWMEKMTKGYVIFHVLVLISCSIALLVMTDNKHTATYVFTDIDSESGWTPIGFSFLFGFLSVSWTMTDYDATAHITEEYVTSPLPVSSVLTCQSESRNLKSRPLGPSQWLCCSPTSLVSSSTLSCASAWAIQLIFSPVRSPNLSHNYSTTASGKVAASSLPFAVLSLFSLSALLPWYDPPSKYATTRAMV